VLDLRSVDADQAEAFDPAGEEHADGVAVDHVRHSGPIAIRGLEGHPGFPGTAEQAEDDARESDWAERLHRGSVWHHDDRMIAFTDRATEILSRSHQAAARFNPDTWIRVFTRSGSVQFALAEGPVEGDQVIENEGFRVAVQQGLEGIVAVREPHDQLFLRPAGSSPVPGEVVDAAGH
jgi:hypothetical protein